MLNGLITSIYHNVSDDTIKEEIKKLRSYIKSFGLVYDNLNRTASFDDVDITAYTKDIGNAVIANVAGNDLAFIYNANSEILMSTDKAILIGLIINELITNSLKHAFSSAVQKQIAINVIKSLDGFLIITYQDNGLGQIAVHGKSNSFGMGMIHQLIKQLKGSIAFDSIDNKKITISVPLT
jgi:two-component sensor histidine kinase